MKVKLMVINWPKFVSSFRFHSCAVAIELNANLFMGLSV